MEKSIIYVWCMCYSCSQRYEESLFSLEQFPITDVEGEKLTKDT